MIVMDANAAFSIISKTEEGYALQSFMETGEEVVAPALLRAEIVHTLYKYVRGGFIDAEQANAKLNECLSLVDRFVSDEDLASEALYASIQLQHSSYDMFYYVLARRLCATLYTNDKKLSNLCLKNGVDCIYQVKLPETLPEDF